MSSCGAMTRLNELLLYMVNEYKVCKTGEGINTTTWCTFLYVFSVHVPHNLQNSYTFKITLCKLEIADQF